MAKYQFRLFIAGQLGNSLTAIANIKALGSQLLRGEYTLEIIDVLERPELADRERVTVTPTLIKDAPLPVRRLIGDLSHTPRVLAGLSLSAEEQARTK
ncbi:MAG: circadian clock KaiB family protein [Myxococcaceae bacterium]|nr:circadian clock KaiB family protein [Myxococcaceae bacterium]